MPIHPFRRLFRLVVRPPPIELDVDAELAFHLETETERLVAGGMPPEQAALEASRRFGDVSRTRAELLRLERGRRARERRRSRLQDLVQDLGYAVRSLGRRPLFAAAVVLTLGLGIGANATMVGLVDRLMLKPPPGIEEPGRLGRLAVTQSFPGFGTYTNEGVSWKDFVNQRDGAASFAGVAATYGGELSLGRGLEARPIRVAGVTASWFPMLGVRAAEGRFFTGEEDRVGAGAAVAVLSKGFRQRQYGDGDSVLGRRLFIGSQWYTVIGVAPRGFRGTGLEAVDVWLPFHSAASDFVGRSGEWRDTYGWQWIRVLGRIRPGLSREAAEAEATRAHRAAVAGEPGLDPRATVTLVPVQSPRFTSREASADVALWLGGVSAIVLLIACANVANLLLARSVSRRREIAVRLALGMGRGRLIRQLLVESVVLALLGGLLALGLSSAGGGILRATLLPGIEWTEGPVDLRIATFTVLATMATGILTGLLPALQASRPSFSGALRVGGGDDGPPRSRLRAGLLIAQAALSVVLLVGAGLFVRSLVGVAHEDLGFEPERVVVVDVDLDVMGTPRSEQTAFYERAYERFRNVPGVASVSVGMAVPFRWVFSRDISIPGWDSLPRPPSGNPTYTGGTPDYFETMGLRLLRGRTFTAADRGGAPLVMVVNEAFADFYWPGPEDALGRCVRVGGDTLPCSTIVGVVATARRDQIREEPAPQYYVPLAQAESMGLSRTRALFVRTRDDPEAMIPVIRRELAEMLPNLPYPNIATMRSMIAPQIQPWRLGATMFGIFGAVALLVALTGLYSVLSYGVARRTRELGVRAALGASPRRLVAGVVGEGVRTVLIGLAIGVLIAMVLGRWVSPLLFRVSPRDPVTFATVIVTLLLTGVLAALLPARRAMRTDPLEALKAE